MYLTFSASDMGSQDITLCKNIYGCDQELLGKYYKEESEFPLSWPNEWSRDWVYLII